MHHDNGLSRRLNTTDAVGIGLAAMIGAGVFSAFAPAAASAGGLLLVSLALAALVATANALSTAQLATQYPESGGAYVYGRERLGPWWGFFAGWSFVVGKTASCAAMAVTVAAYVAPVEWQKPLAVAVVALVGVIGALGIERTALAARIIVITVLAVLAFVVVAGLGFADRGGLAPTLGVEASSPYGVLQGAGLLFFAFAGYARIATLSEEVDRPRVTIRRAVVIALTIALIVYAAVAVVLLSVLGAGRLAQTTDPLAAVIGATPFASATIVVQIGAALAGTGALLALLVGVSRTAMAMARRGDLPRALSRVSARSATPRIAEIAVAVLVIVLVLVADLRSVIGFSSFGVLLYYLVANLAAFTQQGQNRTMPRFVPVIGAVGCVVLAATLPPVSQIGGVIVLVLGLAGRALVLRRRVS